MATYNANIVVNAAVSGTADIVSGSVTLYTAPANGYAVVNIALGISQNSTGSVSVGGRVVVAMNAATADAGSTVYGGRTTAQFVSQLYGSTVTNVHVGPGQSVVLSANGTGAAGGRVSGVSFVNSN